MSFRNRLKQYHFVAEPYRRLRRYLLTASVNTKHRTLNLGLLPSHTGYTRFVIISRGRSGTSLLRSLLNNHPQVTTFGEIFRRYGAIGWDKPHYRSSSAQLELIQVDPVAFLQKYLFCKYPKQIRAVGFKLFYYHARNPEWESMWQYLKASEDIQVIHLKRENMLATRLSLKRAFMTDAWSSTNRTAGALPPLELDYEDCLEAFTQTRQWETQIATQFAGPRLLEMTYEALCEDREAEMKRVQAFLGLAYRPTATSLRQQNQQPLSKSIANYYELKEQFSGTPWLQFFED